MVKPSEVQTVFITSILFACNIYAQFNDTLTMSSLLLSYNGTSDTSATNSSNTNDTNTEGALDCSSTIVSEQDVVTYLKAANSNYSSDARPKRNVSEAVTVLLSLQIFALKNFDEHEGTLIFDGYLFFSWVDDYLQWNSAFPYNCVSLIVVNERQIWRPSLLFTTNSINDFQNQIDRKTMELGSDGTVSYYPHGLFNTNCDPDLWMFPFDYQVCKLVLDCWDNNNQQLTLTLDSQPFAQVPNLWTENRQWEVMDNYSEIRHVNYIDSVIYDRAVFWILLRRKPLFYYVNVIIPGIMLAVVEVVTFLLPTVEVSKLLISVTCLLAYSVFQGMIIGDLPRSGTTFPLLSMYIDLQMAYIGLISILGEGILFLIHRWSEAQKKPPPPLLFHVFKGVGSVLQMYYRPYKHKINDVVSEKDLVLLATQQWHFIAEVIAKFNSVFYVSAVTFTPIMMFYVFPFLKVPPKLPKMQNTDTQSNS